jgi:hypothetical protein
MGLSDDGSVGSLEVQFLDREQYANGAVGGYWEKADLQTSQPQLVILHNNWIKVEDPPLLACFVTCQVSTCQDLNRMHRG